MTPVHSTAALVGVADPVAAPVGGGYAAAAAARTPDGP